MLSGDAFDLCKNSLNSNAALCPRSDLVFMPFPALAGSGITNQPDSHIFWVFAVNMQRTEHQGLLLSFLLPRRQCVDHFWLSETRVLAGKGNASVKKGSGSYPGISFPLPVSRVCSGGDQMASSASPPKTNQFSLAAAIANVSNDYCHPVRVLSLSWLSSLSSSILKGGELLFKLISSWVSSNCYQIAEPPESFPARTVTVVVFGSILFCSLTALLPSQ